MSWAVEEWKEGLTPRVLQKIHELESQVDKLQKERQQRQFQLESLEAALQKQKQKVENEKNEVATLQRETRSLMELCDNLEKSKQKISRDLQVKESQISIQSGQLSSSKKEIERLEQELKRYKCELERSQTSISGDLPFSGTPQRSSTAPLTPVKSHNDAEFEELEEKYKKEVQERKKLELELRTIQVKKINQPQPQSSWSHREIARHQTSSSVFSWQQEKTPSRNQETPARGSSTTSSFPWEKEMNISMSEKNEFNTSFAENCHSSLMMQLRAQNQELNSTVKDLEQQLQAQEKVNKSRMNKHQESELQLNRTKLELTEKEKDLSQTRDTLSQTRTQLDQATRQAHMMEQKLKKMSELNCQRENAESARQSLEQKLKAKEKEYQQELSCQQQSLQMLDQQCNRISNKLKQELQQARNDFNALQAEFGKVTAAKQRLEHDASDLTQKLGRAEQALLAARAKETDLTRSFEEVKQEKKLLDCQLKKKLQEIYQLEEELNTLKQSLKQSQSFAEEMKNKNSSQEAQLKLLQEELKKQESSLLPEKLKIALANMEKQEDATRDLLKEKDNHIKEQKCKINKMEEDSEALHRLLGFKQRECEELQKEATAFSQWKNENDHQLRMMETESDRKNREIRELRDMLEQKSVELEEQKKAVIELQQEAECSDQKYCKEIESMSCKIFQLTSQVGELEEKLQLAASEGLQREQCYNDLLGEYEKIRSLVKAQDTSEDGGVDLQRGQGEIAVDNTQLVANNSIAEAHGCARAFLEVGQTKDLAVLRDQMSLHENSLEAQKQLNSDQQQQYEDFLQIKGETEARLCYYCLQIQLHQALSGKNELAETLEVVQKELQEKESEMKREISEYEDRLLQAEKEHQDALREANQRNEVEIEACQDKMNSLEHIISSQKLEIEHLKSDKEQLSNSLKEANEILGELLKTKNGIDELRVKGRDMRTTGNAMENQDPLCQSLHPKKRGNLLDQENADSEPDGLPEVVRKGFADIPTGRVSPYVLRTTALNLRPSPLLASSREKLPLPTRDTQKCGPDDLGERSCSTAGGSKPKKVTDEQRSQAVTASPPVKSTLRSPLGPYKQPTQPGSDTPRENRTMHKART